MTQDEIIEMARPRAWHGNVEGWTFNSYEELEAFAKLVAEREREEVKRLKALCEEMQSELYVYRASKHLKDVTATIKAKGLA